jgi:thiol:disulfide interchange protein DsbD
MEAPMTMHHGRFTRWSATVFTMLALCVGGANAADFLAPEQAFQLKAEVGAKNALALDWHIAPGYHLYRERITVNADRADVLGEPALPPGVRKFDENFGKEMETYQNAVAVTLPLRAAENAPAFTLHVGYQGCADAGLCYPPAQVSYRVDPARPGMLTALPETPDAAAPNATPGATTAAITSATAAGKPASAAAAQAAVPASAPASEDEGSLAQRTLQSGSLWRIGGAFLVFGLLLSFTPCVLPMLPILSSIIVGEGNVSRGRGLLLAAAYSLGMALVYTALGVGAGLAGEGLAGALQKPWVLLSFGALLVGLALSMFDVYQLQLPSALQSKLSEVGGPTSSGPLRGGRFIGVFVMGALSALIVGPCVAAPLAGALLYISRTRDAWTGGFALFFMAAGMSVPLLLTGFSAGSLLPRAGAWMNNVKKIFGLLLIAVALWMISPVLTATPMMLLWGGFAILCAVFLRVGEALPAGAGLSGHVGRMLGLMFMLGGLFELAGAAGAGEEVLRPLARLGAVAATGEAASPAGALRFTRIRSGPELEQQLAAGNTPAMLDFYADWCAACKEMERNTFPEPQVGGALKNVRLLQVDVTANNADDRALMKRFSLFGPPGIILFGADGKEIPGSRIVGYLPPDAFTKRVKSALAKGQS